MVKRGSNFLKQQMFYLLKQIWKIAQASKDGCLFLLYAVVIKVLLGINILPGELGGIIFASSIATGLTLLFQAWWGIDSGKKVEMQLEILQKQFDEHVKSSEEREALLLQEIRELKAIRRLEINQPNNTNSQNGNHQSQPKSRNKRRHR